MSRESEWIAREISAKVRREFNGRLPKPPEVLPAEAHAARQGAAAMTGADLIRGIGMWAVCILGGVLCWYLAPEWMTLPRDFLYFCIACIVMACLTAYDGRFGFVCVLVFAVWGARYGLFG